MRSFESFFCERCGFVRHFTKRKVDHKFHFAATVFTYGLWGVPWIVLTIDEARRPWRCYICGSRYIPNPETAERGKQPKKARKNHLVWADF